MTDAYKIIKNRSDKRTAFANLRISLFFISSYFIGFVLCQTTWSQVIYIQVFILSYSEEILLIQTALNTWRRICFWHAVSCWWWNPDLRFVCILLGFKISEKLTFRHTCRSQIRIQPRYKMQLDCLSNGTRCGVTLLCWPIRSELAYREGRDTSRQPVLSECTPKSKIVRSLWNITQVHAKKNKKKQSRSLKK